MTTATTSFYVTGGTLRPDAPSYVARQADADLYEGLIRSEFCYVLTARQMGKSSLMVRTATRLRQEGIAVAVLDLAAIGQNLSPEQWYDGLLARLGEQLDLDEELEAFWLANERVGPLQRWMAALREVVLTRCPGPIVLFVDEIDVVQSLPFSSDEFFAGIRECYNRRGEEPAFARLTFCLLGVASPADLIRDTRITPFNIGRRIELTDFTEAEAAPLASGLQTPPPAPPRSGEGSKILEATPGFEQRAGGEGQTLRARILYWTGGHPYLTQRLCSAVAEDGSAVGEAGVDRWCERLFLSAGARERDDNLLFVRERLLRSDADLASLLDLYGQLRRGKRVPNDEANPLAGLLRLAGIARVADGSLRVRNRIYERVFDREWVRTNLPDAELRRQRAAYRRGLLRATTLVGVVTVVTTGLALTAVQQARRADRLARGETRQRRVAEAGQEALRRHLYAAHMNLAQQAWEAGNVAMARALLERYRPVPGQEDLRGFEWRYLWRLCQADARVTLRRDQKSFMGVAFSPDGKLLASGNGRTAVSVWDIGTRRRVATLRGHRDAVSSVAFEADGKTLASGSADGTAKRWDVTTGRPVAALGSFRRGTQLIVFSSEGRLIGACRDPFEQTDVSVWDVARHREVARLKGHENAVDSLAFSPDGRLLATAGASADRSVILWDISSQRRLASLMGHQAGVESVVFSPDGRTVASGSDDSTVRLWDPVRKQEIATLTGHRSCVNDVAFSPDGRLLASASDDLTVRLWDVVTRQEVRILRGHGDRVWGVRFSPDGARLASTSRDGTIKLWDVAARKTDLLRGHTHGVWVVAFSPDGKILASGSLDNTVRLWDVTSERLLGTLPVHGGARHWLAFSPDGRTLATGSTDQTMKLWDVASRRLVASLPGHTRGLAPIPAFSPDGKTLASGDDDATIRLWDIATRRPIARLKGHRYQISSLAYSPDGELLASGGNDSLVKLWDAGRQRAVATLRAHQDWISDLAFSPDGRLLATASMDATVRLWDLTAGKPAPRPTGPISPASGTPGRAGTWPREVATLRGNAGIVDAVAFSPDGRTLATSGAGRLVQLWNVETRELVATLSGHRAQVLGLAFSPDGNLLATNSMDTTVRLWRAASFTQTDARPNTRQRGSAR